MRVTLKLPEPFNVGLTLLRLQRSSYGAPYEFLPGGHAVRRLVSLGNYLALLQFDFSEARRELSVELLAWRPANSTGVVEESGESSSAEWLEGMAASWGLKDNLNECGAALGSDTYLAPLVVRYEGARLARVPDLYEAILVAIVGQQISVKAAHAVRTRLMTSLGESMESGDTTLMTYPRPQRILETDEEHLRQTGLSKQKAKYVLALSEAAVAGELEISSFHDLTDEEAIARLCRIPGVGRWTAEVALFRGLGRLDIFPAGDLGLQVAAQQVLQLPQRPSERQLRALAEPWRPWRSYAALYLWAHLQDGSGLAT